MVSSAASPLLKSYWYFLFTEDNIKSSEEEWFSKTTTIAMEKIQEFVAPHYAWLQDEILPATEEGEVPIVSDDLTLRSRPLVLMQLEA